jgi:hypothetical protein
MAAGAAAPSPDGWHVADQRDQLGDVVEVAASRTGTTAVDRGRADVSLLSRPGRAAA